MVVTSQMQSAATKLETPDIETPQSVSIVTREQFEEQGATSVRQAVSYTPGVYSNQIGASNRFDYMVLRGFSDGSTDNVYLDGLKMMGDTNSHSSLVVDPWFLGQYRSRARSGLRALWSLIAGRDCGAHLP